MHEQRIGLDPVEVNLTLTAGGGGGGDMSAEERRRPRRENAAIRGNFEQGVKLSNEDKYDEAIAKFNEVIAGAEVRRVLHQHRVAADREEGLRRGRGDLQEGDRAEPELGRGLQRPGQPLQRAEEVRSGRGGERPGGQARRRGARAAPARRRCSTRASSPGTPARIADAKKAFEEAVKLDPKLAEAHYWLGMANLNEGKMPEAATSFEAYLKLEPAGKYAEQAKGILDADQEVTARSTSTVRAPAGPWPLLPSVDHRTDDRREPRRGPVAHRRRRPTRRPRTRRRSRWSPSPRHSTPITCARRGTPVSGISAKTRSRKRSRRSPRPPSLAGARWHLIGHLQSNKARKAAAPFAVIHSMDSLDLLERVDAAAAEQGATPRDPHPDRPGGRGHQARRRRAGDQPLCARGARGAGGQARRTDAAASLERKSGSHPAVVRPAAGAARPAGRRRASRPGRSAPLDGHEPRFRGGGRRRAPQWCGSGPRFSENATKL